MAGRDRNKAAVPAKQISKKRLLLFKVIAILMPFFLLAFLEVILRLFGYGYDPHLFIAHPADDNFMVMNPAASKKYFTDPAGATTGNFEPFRKVKDTNTLRIFVLGESTTIGYPYFHNGSFHRWLEYRLMRSLPGKKFEIVNCSLTAVNSYTVLGFAREVVDYQPDAVLIYTGHNEYYGALGVGSTGRISGSPSFVNTLVALRSLKVGQLVTNCYRAIAGLFKSNNPNERKRRMEAMAADQHIPYGRGLFNRGIEQFRSNMDATLRLFNRRHVPVFISNLVSNEKDLYPFVSLPVDSVKLPVAQRIETDAGLNFSLGRMAYEKGDVPQAKAYFSRAIDLDALRFRAPHQMNEVIISLCNKYRSNTHYVDAKTAFEAWSRRGIIGNEVVLEHVHPNLLGYALLSDAFYQAMKLEGIFHLNANEISFRELLRDMPVTTIDSLAGAYRIAALKKGWPFNEPQRDSIRPNTYEEWLANEMVNKRVDWEGAMDQAYNYYVQHQQLNKAGVVIAGLALEHPIEKDYYEKAANIYGKLNDDEKAIFYFRKTFDLEPSVNTARFLFVLYFRIDQPANAMPYLDYAIANGGGTVLSNIKKLAQEIIELEKEASKDKATYRMIAEKYNQMGNKVTAEKYLQLSTGKNENH